MIADVYVDDDAQAKPPADYQSLLVPYDKSEPARRALETAIGLARVIPQCEVSVLYVAEIPDFNDPVFEQAASMAGMTRGTEEDMIAAQKAFYNDQKEQLIEDVAPVVGDFDRIKYFATAGKPHDAIVEFAKTEQYDIVIMGCRGLGALRGIMGSVSSAVIRSVKVPVLIVK